MSDVTRPAPVPAPDPGADGRADRVDTSADRLQAYLGRPLTRRTMLQVMVLGAGAAFLAACSSTPGATGAASAAPSTAPTAAPSASASAAPSASTSATKGGEFRVAWNFEPDSLDPHVASGSSSFLTLMNVVDTLVLLSPDDKAFHPYLADSWTISRGRQGLHVQAAPGREVPRRDGRSTPRP